MWNPFAKQPNEPNRPVPARPIDESDLDVVHAGGRLHHNDIADIELMGKVAVATLTIEELTQDQGVEHLAMLLEDLKETGAKHYVLDIQNIRYMDSMCLGCLVESLNTMGATGGKIALANGEQTVQQLFRITRLDRVFPICRDVFTAIQAVEREAA